MSVAEKFKLAVEYAVKKGKVSSKKSFSDLLGIHETSLYKLFKNPRAVEKYINKASQIAGINFDFFYSDSDDPSKFENLKAWGSGSDHEYMAKLKITEMALEKSKEIIEGLKRELALKDELILMYKEKLESTPPTHPQDDSE